MAASDYYYEALRDAAIVARMAGKISRSPVAVCAKCARELEDSTFKHCVPCRGMMALRRATDRRQQVPREGTFCCKYCHEKAVKRTKDQETCHRKECKRQYMNEYNRKHRRGTGAAK